MTNIWDLNFRDKPDLEAWEQMMLGERVCIEPETKIEFVDSDFDLFKTWLEGLG
jgi:hypothetical protein